MAVLEQIVAAKRAEVAQRRARLPAATLGPLARQAPPPRPFAAALRAAPRPRVIAEVKRASPSRGVLRPELPPAAWDAAALAASYGRGGACALSVLTDVRFFWGDPDALWACREACGLPALRKDFVVDPYQVLESRWLGADAVLLIARVLTPAVAVACAELASELGMDVLLEAHDEADLALAAALPAALVGLNHRDLDSLAVDPERARRLRRQVPAGRLVVAESGLSRPSELAALSAAGLDAFLVGAHLAAAADPEAALRALRAAPPAGPAG